MDVIPSAVVESILFGFGPGQISRARMGVEQPEQRRWSSFRAYYYGERALANHVQVAGDVRSLKLAKCLEVLEEYENKSEFLLTTRGLDGVHWSPSGLHAVLRPLIRKVRE